MDTAGAERAAFTRREPTGPVVAVSAILDPTTPVMPSTVPTGPASQGLTRAQRQEQLITRAPLSTA